MECFAVTDLVRVFEDGYRCPAPQKQIEVFGIRNEVLSAQCVVKAQQPLRDLTVSLSPLKHKTADVVLPADSVTWNFVGSILLAENSPNHRKSDVIRAAPARFPDYLSEARQMAVEAGRCQAVYLTIRVPKEAQAGEYGGTVTFRADKGERTLPLTLTVLPLTLPQERHLMVTEWFSTNRFKQFHGVDSSDPNAFYKMLAVYAQNMADHRQNVFRVSLSLIATTKHSDGKLTFDFSRFDKWCEIFWATGRMDLLETGFVARFRDGGWSSKEIVLEDFRVRDEAKGAFPHNAGQGVPAAVFAGIGAAPPGTRLAGQDGVPHRRRALQSQRHELAGSIGFRTPLRAETQAGGRHRDASLPRPAGNLGPEARPLRHVAAGV